MTHSSNKNKDKKAINKHRSKREGTFKNDPKMPSLSCCRRPSNPVILDADPKTDWKSIYIVALVAFISTMHGQCIMPSVWPYMKLLIPDVSENFYGILQSLVGIGTLTSGLVAGWTSNYLQDTTRPMVVAKFLALISCIVYMIIELVNGDSGRRAMFIVFMIFLGTSSGAAQIYKSHVAMSSTEKDRAKAVAICSLAPSIGIFVGPVGQVAFTALGGYPGLKLLFGLHLNMYTAPVWLVFLVSIVGTALLIFCFDGRMRLRKEDGIEGRENMVEIKENEENSVKVNESDDEVKKNVQEIDGQSDEVKENIHVPQPPCDKLAVFVCLYTRMLLNLCLMNFNSIAIPYTMIAFGWTSEQSVLYIAICMILIGLNLCFWNLAYIFWDLKRRLPERRAIFISIVFLFLAYLLTYPWPFLSGTIPYQLENGTTGCPLKYKWCATTPRVNVWVFLGSLIVVLGVAIPLCTINLDILFSKVLGNIKQGTLQGVMIACGEFFTVFEPLILTQIYTISGPIHIWQFVMVVIALSIILWLFFYRRMIGRTERGEQQLMEVNEEESSYL